MATHNFFVNPEVLENGRKLTSDANPGDSTTRIALTRCLQRGFIQTINGKINQIIAEWAVSF